MKVLGENQNFWNKTKTKNSEGTKMKVWEENQTFWNKTKMKILQGNKNINFRMKQKNILEGNPDRNSRRKRKYKSWKDSKIKL